jgi:hypothetical protein
MAAIVFDNITNLYGCTGKQHINFTALGGRGGTLKKYPGNSRKPKTGGKDPILLTSALGNVLMQHLQKL